MITCSTVRFVRFVFVHFVFVHFGLRLETVNYCHSGEYRGIKVFVFCVTLW